MKHNYDRVRFFVHDLSMLIGDTGYLVMERTPGKDEQVASCRYRRDANRIAVALNQADRARAARASRKP